VDVILDTNIYYTLIYAHGGKFTSANYFVELVTYLKRTNSNLVVPTLVFDELSAKYKRELSQCVKTARDAHESMTRNMMDDWDEFYDPDVNEQVDILRAQVIDPAKGFKSQIVDAYEAISTEEVARRGIQRIRPASAKGEELRDVMLWLFVLEHAKKGKVVFISDDGDFQGATTIELHTDLIHDIGRAKVEVLYYPSLSKFITENSLTSDRATNEEMAALISFLEIARLAEPLLLKLRTRQGKITSAKVTAANIADAQKYRVGDDTFYIEANYTATADLIIESAMYLNPTINTFVTGAQSEPSLYTAVPGLLTATGAWTPPPSVWHPGFSFPSAKQPHFGTFGNTLLPPVSGVIYEPTELHQNYDADLSLKFSLRLKGREKESLQLEELEILKLTIRPKPEAKVQK
jgi:hypothetical protein